MYSVERNLFPGGRTISVLLLLEYFFLLLLLLFLFYGPSLQLLLPNQRQHHSAPPATRSCEGAYPKGPKDPTIWVLAIEYMEEHGVEWSGAEWSE